MSGEQYKFRGHGKGQRDGSKAYRMSRTREEALERREKTQAESPEPAATKVVVVPAEKATDPEAITVTKGEIQLGQAFLRDARKTVAIRGVSLQQVVAEMEFPYKRLLCTRVGGAEILVARARREMDDLESIEVINEVGPDGITRELLKCNFAPIPKNSGQAFLDDFRKGI
jgi:hypothetical protein